jgi:hypothetical protein
MGTTAWFTVHPQGETGDSRPAMVAVADVNTIGERVRQEPSLVSSRGQRGEGVRMGAAC